MDPASAAVAHSGNSLIRAFDIAYDDGYIPDTSYTLCYHHTWIGGLDSR